MILMNLNSFSYNLLFMLISCVLIFFRLLPLDTLPKDRAYPDLLLCVIIAWCMRRPTSTPVVLLAILFLFQDILLQRPLGLFATSAVLLCEWCKRQSIRAGEFPFSVEWLTASFAMIMIFFLIRIVASLSLVPTPPLHLGIKEVFVTILVYPFVVLFMRFGMGLRKTQNANRSSKLRKSG